jgi:hypothetical protein
MVRSGPRLRVHVRRESARRAAAACLVLSLAAVAAPGARGLSDVRPPRLGYAVSTLPNGLRLILH